MSTVTLQEKQSYRIMGMSLPLFGIVTAVVLIATYMEVLPKGMIGAFALMMVIGAILNEIGSHLPIVKNYLGGGPIVIIFGSAALVTYNFLPETSVEIMSNFMKGEGFLDFYIAALITGSILGMNRELLIKASIRYLPAILGGVVAALGLVGVVGAVIGYGAKEAILYIGVPIMGGGMGAGAVPLSQIFGSSLGVDPGEMISVMVPAVALGNAVAIVVAGLLDRLGKAKPYLTGNGELMELKENQAQVKEETKEKEKKATIDLAMMGRGLLLAVSFFVLGSIIGKFFPQVHSYAWMIISVAIVKALNILPREYETGAFQWFQFVMTNLTGVLLVGIGVAFTNLQQVIDAFTIQYVLLVAVTIIGGVVGSGIVGKFVGFYPIEASITAGLCMANMGGTGDVAVLSAADRMKLMPFAQISSRIGGAFMLILASTLLKIFI
ncbi:citrate carrier protein, CCS family [Anaerovirgula multivorans]|uniref:Citrate carrier protein, CCS family n=1 Tax=Anaerovirgula multivorans TaxID=312168 RepID=A0A239H0X2_9FIRM|nr:2-hydroxycarboxylate transporter family protein [Anaerovirgula multivorans]SNS74775.1 citrate carrier protein, CCS family [Anaerovirgula multivorans]